MVVDGQVELQLDDTRCFESLTPSRHCTGLPLHVAWLPGYLAVGSTRSATVTLDHLRIYNFALPKDDVAAESLCTRHGDCREFGVTDWQVRMPIRAMPTNPFVPQTLQFVMGVLQAIVEHFYMHAVRWSQANATLFG